MIARKYSGLLLCSFLIACVYGCTTTKPKYGTTLDDIHRDIQNGLASDKYLQRTGLANAASPPNAALMPPLSLKLSSQSTEETEKRFDVSVSHLPAKIFFMGLVEGTPYNMVVSPDVGGDISVDLKNVSINEAMEAVRDTYGYEYRQTPYGFEVLPQTIQTQMFTVNYLDVLRTGHSSTELHSSEISEQVGSTTSGGTGASTGGTGGSSGNTGQAATLGTSGVLVDTKSEMDFWKSLNTSLKSLLADKPGRSITVNPQAGLVVVSAYPNELRQIATYLDRIQNSMGRQVILEAKVLEVMLNDDFQSGIDWSRLAASLGVQQFGDSTIVNPDFSVNPTFANGVSVGGSTAPNGLFSLTTSGKFSAIINLLETQGNVQTLSNPRISTLNNQKAVIKVGQDQFFVTGVTSNITPGVTASSTAQSQSVTLTPFFSGITLDVTPQISSRGDITLHIHPSVSQVSNDTKTVNLGSSGGSSNILVLPLAKSTVRESDSIVYTKTGQVVVVGRLMQNSTQEQLSGPPLLAKIPVIGAFFRNTNQQSQKNELVILLRATIVDNKTWMKDLRRTNTHFKHLRRGFHLGAHPKVFGNVGETDGW